MSRFSRPETWTTTFQPWWVAWVRRFLGLTPRLLKESEVPLAQRLLYEVYYEEQGWDPPGPNPSGLVANHEARRMEDDFDSKAHWVGVFEKTGELVATTRVLDRRVCGELEIERYITLRDLLAEPRVVEGNRVAVKHSHRTTPVLMCLHGLAEWTGKQCGAVRSVGTATPKIARGPAREHGWHHTGQVFRYHPSDAEPVYVLRCEFDESRRLRALYKLIQRRIKKRFFTR